MNNERQVVGKRGEHQAERFLAEQGYVILGRNVRTHFGEIDLVAVKDDVVVFVEVKTRRSLAYGHPEMAITRIKAEHMRNAALAYLQERPELGDHWRIDVVAIYQPPRQPVEIFHFENALS